MGLCSLGGSLMAVPTHFRCVLHGVTLPLSEYESHCSEWHSGVSIAVMLLSPAAVDLERTEDYYSLH